MVIGKGGETIRALESENDVQIDIEEDGTILIYATDGTKARRRRSKPIQAITKEPEVGDTYTGKVVKTTQFGAFVELKKGTDGLLHVSNVGPGRVGHIEDVIERGDVLDVIVQEVDKARGRIGLKLVAKHENGSLVQPEELIERAKDAPPAAARGAAPRRRPWPRRPRRPAPRARARLGAYRTTIRAGNPRLPARSSCAMPPPEPPRALRRGSSTAPPAAPRLRSRPRPRKTGRSRWSAPARGSRLCEQVLRAVGRDGREERDAEAPRRSAGRC